MTLPPPIRQQVLQSTCQQLLPAAAAGVEKRAAAPVPTTIVNTMTATHFIRFFIVDLLPRDGTVGRGDSKAGLAYPPVVEVWLTSWRCAASPGWSRRPGGHRPPPWSRSSRRLRHGSR